MSRKNLDKVYFFIKKKTAAESEGLIIPNTANRISKELGFAQYEAEQLLNKLADDKYLIKEEFQGANYYHFNNVYSDFKGYVVKERNRRWKSYGGAAVIIFGIAVAIKTLIPSPNKSDEGQKEMPKKKQEDTLSHTMELNKSAKSIPAELNQKDSLSSLDSTIRW